MSTSIHIAAETFAEHSSVAEPPATEGLERAAPAVEHRLAAGAAAGGPLEDLRSTDPVERLLEDSWESRSRAPDTRELTVEALAALLFLCCAGPLAIAAVAKHPVEPLLALAMVGLYAISSRLIMFPIGAGYVVPSYLVLVP